MENSPNYVNMVFDAFYGQMQEAGIITPPKGDEANTRATFDAINFNLPATIANKFGVIIAAGHYNILNGREASDLELADLKASADQLNEVRAFNLADGVFYGFARDTSAAELNTLLNKAIVKVVKKLEIEQSAGKTIVGEHTKRQAVSEEGFSDSRGL